MITCGLFIILSPYVTGHYLPIPFQISNKYENALHVPLGRNSLTTYFNYLQITAQQDDTETLWHVLRTLWTPHPHNAE